MARYNDLERQLGEAPRAPEAPRPGSPTDPRPRLGDRAQKLTTRFQGKPPQVQRQIRRQIKGQAPAGDVRSQLARRVLASRNAQRPRLHPVGRPELKDIDPGFSRGPRRTPSKPLPDEKPKEGDGGRPGHPWDRGPGKDKGGGGKGVGFTDGGRELREDKPFDRDEQRRKHRKARLDEKRLTDEQKERIESKRTRGDWREQLTEISVGEERPEELERQALRAEEAAVALRSAKTDMEDGSEEPQMPTAEDAQMLRAQVEAPEEESVVEDAQKLMSASSLDPDLERDVDLERDRDSKPKPKDKPERPRDKKKGDGGRPGHPGDKDRGGGKGGKGKGGGDGKGKGGGGGKPDEPKPDKPKEKPWYDEDAEEQGDTGSHEFTPDSAYNMAIARARLDMDQKLATIQRDDSYSAQDKDEATRRLAEEQAAQEKALAEQFNREGLFNSGQLGKAQGTLGSAFTRQRGDMELDYGRSAAQRAAVRAAVESGFTLTEAEERAGALDRRLQRDKELADLGALVPNPKYPEHKRPDPYKPRDSGSKSGGKKDGKKGGKNGKRGGSRGRNRNRGKGKKN